MYVCRKPSSKVVKLLQDQTAPQLNLLKDTIDSVQKLKNQLSSTLDVSIKELNLKTH